MATEITVPALGESVTEGSIGEWLKQPGDAVDRDETILEIATDKVDTEVPAPNAGILVSEVVQREGGAPVLVEHAHRVDAEYVYPASAIKPFVAAAALRANEIGADILFKATKVDGIYSSDPEKNADAVLIPEIDYGEVLKRGLRVMDAAAISLCMDNRIPIQVFNIREAGILRDVVIGKKSGSLVGPKEDV